MSWTEYPAYRGAVLLVGGALGFLTGFVMIYWPPRRTERLTHLCRWMIGPSLAFVLAPVAAVFGVLELTVDYPIPSAGL